MSRETKNWMIGRFSEKNFKVRQEKNKKFPDLELSLRELKTLLIPQKISKRL